MTTTAPLTLGSGAVLRAEAVHVTGRRMVATIIDGMKFEHGTIQTDSRCCCQDMEGLCSSIIVPI